MSGHELDEKLENIDDEKLSQLLEFVERMGGVEDAQAAVDALKELSDAA